MTSGSSTPDSYVPPPRCNSALARSGSLKIGHTFALLQQLPSYGSGHFGDGLGQLVIAGSPAPLGIKKERPPPVVVSAPTPIAAPRLPVPRAADADSASTTPPSTAPPAVVSPTKPTMQRRRASTRTALSLPAASKSSKDDASVAAAAGSGVSAVAMLSSRGRSREPAAASSSRSPKSNNAPSSEAAPTLQRSRSLASSVSAAVTPAVLTARSRSVTKENRMQPVQSPSSPDTLSKTVSATMSTTTTTPQPRKPSVAAASGSTHGEPKAPVIKKYIVQANAYHSTFVQTMMMSRGPEWKPTMRCADKIGASDIAGCDFVWFKYEYIKSLPHIDRLRLPPPVVDALVERTRQLRAMWDEGVSAWPDRTGQPLLKALDLLNAYIIPEQPEEPAPTTPLTNIYRKRMPSMLLCQGSIAHTVGSPPGNTPDDVVRQFHQLKSLLHYHHMKYVAGTPIVACFKDASAVWRKHMLYRYTKQFCDNDPETRGSVRERMPASYEYDLTSPDAADGARTFMTTLMKEAGVVRWLAKATGGANGNGFYVTKDPEDMIRYVSGQKTKGQSDADFWVIQEFVENMPLLFDGHRFHMKVHIVMIGTPVGIDVYAYKKQRIQCCSEVFDADVMAPLSYIGNWGQQRFATNLVQEKFSTLLEDIKGEYPKLIPAFHRAKQVIAESIEAAWRCGREHFAFEPGCYELMGWDFVMEECPDGEWRPLLVEANHRPGFGSERKYMEKLIHEVLELVMYPINGLTKHHKEVHNGVVEAIWDHVKTIVIDPLGLPMDGAAAASAASAAP